jgi:ketosteroid isomerase-like protein
VAAGSLSQAEIDYIREMYQLFEDGDPAFLDRFTPDATLVFPETLPRGGTYDSPLEALEFWNNIGELFEDPHPELEEFIRDGDRLVVLGAFHGRARATGKETAARFAHVLVLSGAAAPLTEQRFTAFELIVDTAAALAALGQEFAANWSDSETPGLTRSQPASANLSPEDVESLREGYRRFQEHDATFMDRYTPAAPFVFPTSLPAGGTFEGPWEALEFMTTVNERVDDAHPEPEEFIRDADRLVVLGHWYAQVRTTGGRAAVRIAHVFSLSGGDEPLSEQQITSFEWLGDSGARRSPRPARACPVRGRGPPAGRGQ